jgi:hypothetical protein
MNNICTLEVYWDCVRWFEELVDAHEMEVLEVCFARLSLVAICAELINELSDWHFALSKVSVPIYFIAERDTSIAGTEGVLQGRIVRDYVPGSYLACGPFFNGRPAANEASDDTWLQRAQKPVQELVVGNIWAYYRNCSTVAVSVESHKIRDESLGFEDPQTIRSNCCTVDSGVLRPSKVNFK